MDQIDLRLMVAALAILLAGATKGVTGMGLPVVATPFLAALFDVRTAIAITIIPTTLSDLPILYTFRAEWRQLRWLVPLVVAGMVGIVIGTRILVRVDQRLLAGVLGVSVLAFVATSWFRPLSRLDTSFAKRWGAAVGWAGGLLQGATGASGPIITILFYQLNLSRAAFLFVINAFFLMLDTTQLVSLISVGVFTPRLFLLALSATFLVMPTLFLALRFQARISDQVFHRAVLLVLALTGLVLLGDLLS